MGEFHGIQNANGECIILYAKVLVVTVLPHTQRVELWHDNVAPNDNEGATTCTFREHYSCMLDLSFFLI